MTNPLVTVICVCYNQGRFIREALQSVKNQTYAPIELVIADDGSTDESVAIIREWKEQYPDTILSLNETNTGYCSTFNRAWQKSHGAYFIDLAADDVLLPGRVADGVKQLQEAGSNFGVAFSDVEYVDEDGAFLSLHSERFPHETIPQGDIYQHVIDRYFISAPSMMCKREVLEYLQGYDELLTYEDFDFWVRSSRSFHYVYSNEVSLKKRLVKGSLSGKQFQLRSAHSQSTYRVCEKIFELDKSTAERKALNRRIKYEMRLNLRLLNFSLVYKYFLLWRKNR